MNNALISGFGKGHREDFELPVVYHLMIAMNISNSILEQPADSLL